MKQLILASLVWGSVAGFGATLKCVVADGSNQNRVAVPTTVIGGALVVEPKVTVYNGYRVSVQYQKGDRFEPQTILTLTADDTVAQTYNVSEKGLYQLIRKDLFLQCYFE